MTAQDQNRAPRDWRGRKGRDERAPFWYVVSVQRGHELRIEQILKDMGFMVRLPVRVEYRDTNRFTKARRRAGRRPKEERRFPLFGGMMLIGFAAEPPAWKYLYDKGLITGALAVNGRPRRLRKLEVAEFRLATWGPRFHASEEERYMATHKEFAVGEWVRPIGESWESCSFQVTEIEADKAKIFMDLFDRPQDVEYPVDHLERVR